MELANLMQTIKLKETINCPILPPEIWDIIIKKKKEIEEYEKTLTLNQLYQRRLRQGWLPIGQNNWIYESQKKRWNQMYFLEKLLWTVGLLNEPKLRYVDKNKFCLFPNYLLTS